MREARRRRDERAPEAREEGEAEQEARGPSDAGEETPPEGEGPGAQDRRPTYLRVGMYAWATLGLAGLVALALLVVTQLALIVVPLVLALFPAALLWPLAEWLRRHGLPGALVALVCIVATLAVVTGLVAGIVPVVAAELPDLAASFSLGLDRVDELLRSGVLGIEMGGIEELGQRVREEFTAIGEVAGGALSAVAGAVEVIAGALILLVALFFYLKDGTRLSRGVASLVPRRALKHVRPVATSIWETIGGFLRGQLLVALVDAVFIGLGLALLQVPLAFPLAVIVFFGGLFPIVGAFVSGLIAVLVALADGGLLLALAVLAVVIGVQQLEGNVLQPFVLGHLVQLHPLVVLSAIAAGGALAGVLGAFLAVPVSASVARAVEYVRGERAAEAG